MNPYRLRSSISVLLVAAIALIPAIAACTPATETTAGAPLDGARLEPASGAYFGVNLNWDADSPSEFNQRLGHRAAVYVRFFGFPMSTTDLAIFDDTVSAIAAEHGMLMVTLEPAQGLGAVTPAAIDVLVTKLVRADASGVQTFVRFAHEMNGSWYPWGQQPRKFIDTYRMIADAVHHRASNSAMLWAPNYGGGYPFIGGGYEAHAGSPDFALLDTSGDGRLDMADDPYGPYYPGDDAVDWVGLSLYHWGNQYPWGENEIPEAGKFSAQLHGKYKGLNGDDSAIPDFYETYGAGHNKPVAIPETAAFYDPARLGAGELNLKQEWWQQALDPVFLAAHPGIKMIDWFEWSKPEAEAGGALIDWRALGSPTIADGFRRDLPLGRLIFAP